MSRRYYQFLLSFVLITWSIVGLKVYFVTGIVKLLFVSLMGAGASLGLLWETLKRGNDD